MRNVSLDWNSIKLVHESDREICSKPVTQRQRSSEFEAVVNINLSKKFQRCLDSPANQEYDLKMDQGRLASKRVSSDYNLAIPKLKAAPSPNYNPKSKTTYLTPYLWPDSALASKSVLNQQPNFNSVVRPVVCEVSGQPELITSRSISLTSVLDRIKTLEQRVDQTEKLLSDLLRKDKEGKSTSRDALPRSGPRSVRLLGAGTGQSADSRMVGFLGNSERERLVLLSNKENVAPAIQTTNMPKDWMLKTAQNDVIAVWDDKEPIKFDGTSYPTEHLRTGNQILEAGGAERPSETLAEFLHLLEGKLQKLNQEDVKDTRRPDSSQRSHTNLKPNIYLPKPTTGTTGGKVVFGDRTNREPSVTTSGDTRKNKLSGNKGSHKPTTLQNKHRRTKTEFTGKVSSPGILKHPDLKNKLYLKPAVIQAPACLVGQRHSASHLRCL